MTVCNPNGFNYFVSRYLLQSMLGLSLNLETNSTRILLLKAEEVSIFTVIDRLMSECCAFGHERSERSLHYENTIADHKQPQMDTTLLTLL